MYVVHKYTCVWLRASIVRTYKQQEGSQMQVNLSWRRPTYAHSYLRVYSCVQTYTYMHTIGQQPDISSSTWQKRQNTHTHINVCIALYIYGNKIPAQPAHNRKGARGEWLTARKGSESAGRPLSTCEQLHSQKNERAAFQAFASQSRSGTRFVIEVITYGTHFVFWMYSRSTSCCCLYPFHSCGLRIIPTWIFFARTQNLAIIADEEFCHVFFSICFWVRVLRVCICAGRVLQDDSVTGGCMCICFRVCAYVYVHGLGSFQNKHICLQ